MKEFLGIKEIGLTAKANLNQISRPPFHKIKWVPIHFCVVSHLRRHTIWTLANSFTAKQQMMLNPMRFGFQMGIWACSNFFCKWSCRNAVIYKSYLFGYMFIGTRVPICVCLSICMHPGTSFDISINIENHWRLVVMTIEMMPPNECITKHLHLNRPKESL